MDIAYIAFFESYNEAILFDGNFDIVDFKGSQIRTSLVPFRNKEGIINENDKRQGLRFCFLVKDIGSTINVDGVNYEVKSYGALAILDKKLTNPDMMKIENVGVVSGLINQSELINWEEDGVMYKAAYVYNIHESNMNDVIVSRAYMYCENASGDSVYVYSDVLKRSVFSVYQSILNAGQGSILNTEVKDWFNDD